MLVDMNAYEKCKYVEADIENKTIRIEKSNITLFSLDAELNVLIIYAENNEEKRITTKFESLFFVS